MPSWTVEFDSEFLQDVHAWSDECQLELLAIQQRLERSGPEALGFIKAEWEGVPAWESLGSQVSLPLPIDTPSGWSLLSLEIQPNFRITIVKLE